MKTVHAIVLCKGYYHVYIDVPDTYTIEDAEKSLRERLPYIPADNMEWESDEDVDDVRFV